MKHLGIFRILGDHSSNENTPLLLLFLVIFPLFIVDLLNSIYEYMNVKYKKIYNYVYIVYNI